MEIHVIDFVWANIANFSCVICFEATSTGTEHFSIHKPSIVVTTNDAKKSINYHRRAVLWMERGMDE